ncbi:recombination protein F [Leminorella richardii]|uniref:Recombination protein F n=1 Tax=Leminorella richardii TaxID=158841 RepID=A0A2X4UI63_9GAMM|nr:ATP-dependent endonuclease [Leminorella richardii]SQI39547.1 recombination protein F [Leminorella richardii]
MFLERIEIVGFRGINRLSLLLNDNVVLIGENAWGKSSLLDALTLLFSSGNGLYEFKIQDFHYPLGDVSSRLDHLHIVLTFCARDVNSPDLPKFKRIRPLWVKNGDARPRIFYRLEADVQDTDKVVTSRSFLDSHGQTLELDSIDEMAREITGLHPVLRLRDARFGLRLKNGNLFSNGDSDILTKQLSRLATELECNPHKISNKDLRLGLQAIHALLKHYFSAQFAKEGADVSPYLNERYRRDTLLWQSLAYLNQLLSEPESRHMRLMLLGVFSALINARGPEHLDEKAVPLLLIEDPESRLHPIMLSAAWGLLDNLPLQKITTTNSGELLSLVPLESVNRLVRQSSRTAAFKIDPGELSVQERRRISFHIRLNRASSLFARSWLLVEGETEVWLLTELAKQCGYHFESEGIKVIEFAQSGLRPLLKYASRMGIEWHVLVDGDDAGKKYAETVRSFVNGSGDSDRERLTQLPALDMENFMYKAGFSEVYHNASGIPASVHMPMRKIISKAIQHSSKPDLAIEVAERAGALGTESIPPLLKKMFSRILWLARGRASV